MPDERQVERYVERLVEAIGGLTNQLARLAYAQEANVLVSLTKSETFVKPCKACGCRLISTENAGADCPACFNNVGA